MEDIKVLENWLKELDKIFEKTRINNTKERTALRNLIARNKELEIKQELLKILQNKINEQKIFINEIKEDYIPKSKVQEVLDEFGKQVIEDNTVIRFYKAIQKLVQEGDK